MTNQDRNTRTRLPLDFNVFYSEDKVATIPLIRCVARGLETVPLTQPPTPPRSLWCLPAAIESHEASPDPANERVGRGETPAQELESGTNEEQPQEGQEQGGEGDVGALGGCGGFLSLQSAVEKGYEEVGGKGNLSGCFQPFYTS